MSSVICGLCNQPWHVSRDIHGGVSGQIWTEDHGFHKWQEPTKEQIKERLRKRYGFV